MARGETRYQRIHRLLREGQCGLLPLDLSCPCARRGGPAHPDPDHPGKVGFLTCLGCEHNAGLHFTSRVCTHPNARQVAARWLAEAIRAWQEQHAQMATVQAKGQVAAIQETLSPSAPDPPQREEPVQLTMPFV